MFDEEDTEEEGTESEVETGEYNLGDDTGTRVGEGHDPIEDSVT